MTWLRIDDDFADHPKVDAAGNAAVGLWVRAATWSARYLTDGHVTGNTVRRYGTAAEARTLERVGLWVPDGCDGAVRIPDWLEFQPSREQVLAERAASKERQRAARERRRKDGAA